MESYIKLFTLSGMAKNVRTLFHLIGIENLNSFSFAFESKTRSISVYLSRNLYWWDSNLIITEDLSILIITLKFNDMNW